MSKDVLAYCYRAAVRYLNGDMDLFKHYRDMAMQIYDKEERLAKEKRRLYVPIKELIQR